MELCAELQQSIGPGGPLVIVRGLSGKKIDLRDFFDTRPDEWNVAAMGGRPKGSLSEREKDRVRARLDRLSSILNSVGAIPEGVSSLAAVPEKDPLGRGRLARHIHLNISTRRAIDEKPIQIPLSREGVRLEVSYDELAATAVRAPSRSIIYGRIDALIDEKIRDMRSKGIDDGELKRSALQMTSILKGVYVDRAYNTIFQNPGELLIEGQFNLGHESINGALAEMRRFGGRLEQLVSQYLRKYPTVRPLTRFIPTLFERTYFILMVFNATPPAQLLTDIALHEVIASSGKLLARLGWDGFQQMFYNDAMAQPYDPAWDNLAVLDDLTAKDLDSRARQTLAAFEHPTGT